MPRCPRVVPRWPCPRDAPRSSCCQVALSTSPTSPAPPPLSMAHIFRHGKLRPRHPLPHRAHVHHPFLVAAGKDKAKPPRKKCHDGSVAADKRARSTCRMLKSGHLPPHASFTSHRPSYTQAPRTHPPCTNADALLNVCNLTRDRSAQTTCAASLQVCCLPAVPKAVLRDFLRGRGHCTPSSRSASRRRCTRTLNWAAAWCSSPINFIRTDAAHCTLHRKSGLLGKPRQLCLSRLRRKTGQSTGHIQYYLCF